jgi:transcriptional regulator with PAS, ATPase and Fis domain
MAKFVFVLPREEMEEEVKEVLQKLNFTNTIVKASLIENTVEEVQGYVKNGVDVIIARGYQAHIIKQNISHTVIDIAMTGQEMGVIVSKAKKMIRKKRPVIAVVGFENMFCDMRCFDELYGIKLRTYYVDNIEEIASAVKTANSEGADLIIGGDRANMHAQKLDMPYIFVDALSEDSIKSVLSIAKGIGRAIDLEKLNTAQLKTLLDYSFNGIIKLNKEGCVDALNPLAEELLKVERNQAVGEPITKLIKSLDQDLLKEVYTDLKESYASYMRINNAAYAVSLAPIILEHQVDGAIISFNEVQNLVEMEAKIRKEIYFKGHAARYEFEYIEDKSLSILKEIKKAKIYAQTSASIIVTGAAGSEKDILTQCIHNNSPHNQGPYAFVKCSAHGQEMQFEYLFGNKDREEKGIINLAHGGTLVLSDVEYLTKACQQALIPIILKQQLIQPYEENTPSVRIRVIATTSSQLLALVHTGEFSHELFYALNTLSLSIPPLYGRKSDIEAWTDYYIKEYCKKYSRYIVLTTSAKKVLKEYGWEGNLTQLQSFCERIVIAAIRRTVDEKFVERLLVEAYPIVRNSRNEDKVVVYKSLEAAEIAALLETYKGNRTAVANKLGISTTTLWRKIKKLGIENIYQ